MKLDIHAANDRGEFKIDWLDARYSFSFAEWRHPDRMGFGKLRVLNDDIIQPSGGFATHGHANMEIVTVPISGAIEHKDSTGEQGVIQHGEVQLMSAGSGIRHSEFNPSSEESANTLQIWILPAEEDTPPGYQQKRFPAEERQGNWQRLVSPDGEAGSLTIRQKAYFSMIDLDASQSASYQTHGAGQGIYLFVIHGSLTLGEHNLGLRDAAAITETEEVSVTATEKAKALLIEVPMN